jgi:hypothetical protein
LRGETEAEEEGGEVEGDEEGLREGGGGREEDASPVSMEEGGEESRGAG